MNSLIMKIENYHIEVGDLILKPIIKNIIKIGFKSIIHIAKIY